MSKRMVLFVSCLILSIITPPSVAQFSARVKSKGTVTKVVAAVDSLAELKRLADVVCDGVADDVTIESMLASNRVIHLMAGTYTISGNIELSGYSNITLEGDGPQTLIYNAATQDISCIYQSGPASNITIRNLKVDNNYVANSNSSNQPQNKCVFVNGTYSAGDMRDIGKTKNILIEGVHAVHADAEAIVIDYSENVTVRNCYTDISNWAGIAVAFVRNARIYDNYIERSGIDSDGGGGLGYGINLHSTWNTSCFSNYIRNPQDGGIAITADSSTDSFDASKYVSVFSNQIIGNGRRGIWVSTVVGTLIPSYINIHDNFIQSDYITSCSYDHTGNANGERNLSKAGTYPFLNFHIGDEIYLTANGGVSAGHYYVGAIDSSNYDYIQIAEVRKVTPANIEVGDVFTLDINTTSQISFTATTATAQNVVEGLYTLANNAAVAGTAPWNAYRIWEDNTAIIVMPIDMSAAYTVTATATNGGAANTQTFTDADLISITGDGTVNCTHGSSGEAIGIDDGSEVRIYNNFLDGQGTAAGLVIMSGMATASTVRQWDNYFGPNYSYEQRSLDSDSDWLSHSDHNPVVRTAATTAGRYPAGTIFINTGDTGSLTYTLPTAQAGLGPYTFIDAVNTAGVDCVIDAGAADDIYDVDGITGTGVGQSWTMVSDAYVEITLQCYTNGRWQITRKIGTITNGV